jgi:hypothetical protein
MIGSDWKIAATSVAGTSHVKSGVPCQDAHETALCGKSDDSTLIIAVSDGAGSASRSADGASLACKSFIEFAGAKIADGSKAELLDRSFYLDWLALFFGKIRELASRERVAIRDFSCTFLAAIADASGTSFAQIGDGAIVVSEEIDDYTWVFWPQNGEYANVTNFATDLSASQYIECATNAKPITELAIFTDGLQGLALQLQAKAVFQPFFQSIFKPMRSNGPSETLSKGLKGFLNSRAVNDRTDDDKTLVLASRVIIKRLQDE